MSFYSDWWEDESKADQRKAAQKNARKRREKRLLQLVDVRANPPKLPDDHEPSALITARRKDG